MINIIRYLCLYLWGTRAVSAMEYAIIAGVVVAGVGGAVVAFQDEVVTLIGGIGTDLAGTTTSGSGDLTP